MNRGFLRPFRGSQGGRRVLRGIARGTRRAIRAARPRQQRRGCCCCPAFFVLGLAGLGMIAGSIYAGIRFLPLIL